jgi:hypothetical protein
MTLLFTVDSRGGENAMRISKESAWLGVTTLVVATGGLLLGYGTVDAMIDPPAHPAGIVITVGSAPTGPVWATVADCEDNGGQVPCYTIDDGPDGLQHWLIVTSYDPYRALILDELLADNQARTED